MNYRMIFSALSLITCVAFSCKKENKTNTLPTIDIAMLSQDGFDIPYDTTGMDGIYLAHALQYQSRATFIVAGGMHLSYTARINVLDEAISLQVNSHLLTRGGKMFKSPFTESANESEAWIKGVRWRQTGTAAYNFEYNDADTFCRYYAYTPTPDSIAVSGPVAIHISKERFGVADTLLLKVMSTSDFRDIWSLHVSPSTDYISIPDSIVNEISGQQIILSSSGFTHRIDTFNGHRCLFVKQTTEYHNIWVK